MTSEATVGRVPPHDLVAERSVLGGILLLPEAIQRVLALNVKPETFYRDAHALIFEAMLVLHAGAVEIDSVTLRERLATSNKLQRIGGDEYLGSLTDTIPTVANIQAHAKIVLEKAALRRVIHELHSGAAAGYSGNLEDAQEAARRALEHRHARSIVLYTPRQMIEAAEESARSRTRGIGGISTGYRLLEPYVAHMDPGEVITIGGQSGCGKSHLTLGVAVNVARAGHRVGICSTEDALKRWGTRTAVKFHEGLTPQQMAMPQLNFEQRERVEKAKSDADVLSEYMRSAIVPNESLDVVLESVDHLLEWGAELIVLDHFHAIRLPSPAKGETNTNVVTNAVLSLVHRVRRAGAVLMLAAQFSQPDKARPFAQPTMRDFKDSKQFEISSDYSILTWKPSDQSKAPIYLKVAKLKDSDERPRFRMDFAPNGAFRDIVHKGEDTDGEADRGNDRGGGYTRKSGAGR